MLGTFQLVKSLNYTHDMKEQDSPCPLAEQYPHQREQLLLNKKQ